MIKNIIKFVNLIIADLKEDFHTLGAILAGKAHLKVSKEELFSGWGQTFRANWLIFIIIILAFFSGMFVAGKYYQNECNTIIVKEFYPKILVDNYPKLAEKYGLTYDTKSLCEGDFYTKTYKKNNTISLIGLNLSFLK